MRYHELLPIAEMALPSSAMKQQTFYHGTKDEDKGRSILANGLLPGNTTAQSRGHLKPIPERTYLTTDLKYGIIYCGGGIFNGSEDMAKYLIDKDGRYGWLFVISRDKIANDIQPDEDSVGEAVMFADRILNGKELKWYQDNPLCRNLLKVDRDWLRAFDHNAKSAMTPNQWKGAVNGFVASQAAGGKRYLKVMSDAAKLMLIQCGAHIAYQGPLVPDQAWRFDKQNAVRLTKSGRNFFNLAERVR